MRGYAILGLVGLALAALLYYTPDVEASTNCHGSGNWCQGWAQVSGTTGGVSGTRCFSVRTTNSAPACTTTTSNEGTWEANAGACITLYYFDTSTGLSPPPVPNKLTLTVRFDNSGTTIKTFLSAAAEPANGSSYSFCMTSTGDTGGAERAGTYEIFINPVKDNGPAGVGNYNINSDGTGATQFDQGALRGKIKVASIARNAYPSGSTFAYGPAGDEQITITSTFTQPNGDANQEGVANAVVDSATGTIGAIGSTVDVDTTSLAQNFVVDSTFPNANSPYIAAMKLGSTSVLTSMAWTIMASSGHGTNIVVISDSQAYDSTTFNIDPRIRLDSDGSGGFAAADETDVSKLTSSGGAITELFNRGETVYHEWFIYNARDQLLSRAMTHVREDASNTNCASYGSLTPTSNKYSQTTTLATGGSCAAAADTTGSLRRLQVSNTDQDYQSGNVFFVSSLLRFDTDGTGSPDGDFLTCLTSCGTTEIGVYNRGETLDYEGYLINARGTQYQASTVSWTIRDSVLATTNTQSLTHSSGKYSGAAFALSSTEKATADTTGDPHTAIATHNGNTATTAGTLIGVSSLYFLDAHIQISATLSMDNFPTEDATEDFAYFIRGDGGGGDASDTVHLWCHVVGVRKDVNIDTSGNVVVGTIKDPSTTTRATGTTDTASNGWNPSSLNLLASTPLGTWTAQCTATFTGNTGTDTESFTVDVEGGGGGDTFTGDPLKIFGGDAAFSGEVVRLAISEAFLDGTARTGNAAGTFVRILTPTNTLEITDANPTELSHGVYRYDWTPATTGPYIILARTTDPDSGDPIGTANIVYVRGAAGTSDNDTVEQEILTELTEHRANSLELLMTSNFLGIGFDGFLFFVLFLSLLIFFWWQSMTFAAAWTIPAIFISIIPDFDLSFLLCVVLIVIGIGMQFFKEKKKEKEEQTGVDGS